MFRVQSIREVPDSINRMRRTVSLGSHMGSRKLSVGLIQVYCGNGKGKTTAALGVGLRAVGHGLKVYMIQFMKGQSCGETESTKVFGRSFVIAQFGLPTYVRKGKARQRDVEAARKGLAHAKKIVSSGTYDVVILDEANVALKWGLLRLPDVLGLIRSKPPHVELILTGRYASKTLVKTADLVTEFRQIKHPFSERGLLARKGIDY